MIFLNAGAAGLQIRDETTGALLRTLAPANPGGAFSGVAVANGFSYWLSGAYLNAWSLPPGSPTPTATPGGPTPTSPPPATATPTATPGGPGEPCVAPDNRPYFRPGNNATRGQMSKIAAAAFFPNCQTPARR